MTALLPAGAPSGVTGALADVGAMVREAQQRWGTDSVARVIVDHPGDAASRVRVVRGDAGRVSVSPRYLVFDGASGTLRQVRDQTGPAAETRGVLYGLHVARFADAATRWLFFLSSLAGTTMVATGLVLWTVKRRAKLPDPENPYFGFQLVERLNIASIAGLSIAMAAFLWSNSLLPGSVLERAEWEIHIFFFTWALTLAHTTMRPPKKAWVDQLWLAAVLLALLPVLNAAVTQRPFWVSIAQGDWVFLAFDLTLWALAGLHATLAIRTMRHRPKTRPMKPAQKRRLPTVLEGEGT
ncbi:PepSY-associated TM region [compost metagenome]